MALFSLEALVLRGVCVWRDAQTIGLRLGTSYKANARTPEVPISMRHPLPGCNQGFNAPAGRPDHADELRVDGAAPGAGRPRSRAGVLSRRSPARTAGRAILSGWSLLGGPTQAAAASPGRIPAGLVASVGEVPPGRRVTVTACLLARGPFAPPAQAYARGGVAWCKPATRTLPASTRGTEVGSSGTPF
jgi:hypothetical protein